MTDIKICGLSTPETLDAAVDAGATHVGFVQFEKSPRHLALEDAAKLRRRVPENVKLVLVTVAMQPEALARAYDVIRPDVIQFHGSETAEWIGLIVFDFVLAVNCYLIAGKNIISINFSRVKFSL